MLFRSPSVYEDLGYNLYFVDNGKFGADRKIAFNGRTSDGMSSPQKCIRITGDYTITKDDGIWGLNNPGVNATPMNSGEVAIYFFKLFKYDAPGMFATKIFKTNIFDHEVGHSCYLAHHYLAESGQTKDCLMHNGKKRVVYSDLIQLFDVYCKGITMVIVK